MVWVKGTLSVAVWIFFGSGAVDNGLTGQSRLMTEQG